jgi:hypothetical protein
VDGNFTNKRRYDGDAWLAEQIARAAKSVSMLWREMEMQLGDAEMFNDVNRCTLLRPVCGMIIRWQTGRKANAPLDEVRKCFEKAAHWAALAAPYRHPRLSAVKHLEHADALDEIKVDATTERCNAAHYPTRLHPCCLRSVDFPRRRDCSRASVGLDVQSYSAGTLVRSVVRLQTHELFAALAQVAHPRNADDWGSDRQIDAENLLFDAVCRELTNE